MSTYENQKEFDRMYLAWEQYIKEGVINHEVVRPVIARSWLRSRGYGIDPFDEKILTISDTKEISKRLSSSSALVKAAHPLMIAAYKMVSGSKFRVDLTDAEGYFLFSVGQDEVFRKTSKLNPMTGVCRSESWIGTCGIALALVENEPIQIYSAEHYNCHLHEWTCSSVPIHSPTGEILGALNISGHYSLIHRHTLGMAVGMARAIELSLGNTQTIDNLRDYQKVTDLIIKEVCDGLVVFDREGKVLQSNPKGLEIFLSLKKKGGNELTNILQNDEEIADKEITAVINRRKKSFYMTKRTISEENRGGIRECLVFKDLENVHKIAQRIHGKQAFYTFADIIGEHEAIRNAVQEANIATKEDCPVLLIGETGTGKEMFAQAIHNTSSRGGPFIAINCGAVPADLIESELFGYEAGAFTGAREGGKPGKIEMADGGSLFLDELDSMPLSMQTKLLRVLQTKQVSRIGGYNDIPVDIRLISASKKDLFAEVKKGVFRDDLFFRVNIVTIHIPALRNWLSDIPLLCDHFLKRLIARNFKQIKGISSETMDIFMGYSWPGNVRELEGCIERAYIFEERPYITPKSIPSYIHKQKEVFSDGEATTEVATLEDMEFRVIQRTLRNYNGNISQAARSLGIARDSLYRKIRKFGLRN